MRSKEEKAAYARAYRRKNLVRDRARRTAYSCAYYRKNAAKIQRRRYELEAIRAGVEQPTRPAPEKCECCHKRKKRRLCRDHDHLTGRFRGWLCAACNIGIGALGDTLPGVDSAREYLLKSHQESK